MILSGDTRRNGEAEEAGLPYSYRYKMGVCRVSSYPQATGIIEEWNMVVNPETVGVIAVEIGGTKLQVALSTLQGELVLTRKGTAPVSGGAPAILEWFGKEIPVVLQKAGERNFHVKALGVGFGGPVESATGRALVSHQVSGWENIPLKEWFEQRFGLPAVVANDSNAAGWAEYRCGAGRGTKNFFYTNIGSGIGGALIIQGQLYDGQGLGAAEMGHTYIPDWTSNAPGVPEKVENLCSGWAIERRLRQKTISAESPLGKLTGGDAAKLTCAALGEAAQQGDPVALQEIEQVARGVGTAISNVITLFHPECVAIGGGVALLGEILLDPVRKYVGQLVFKPYRGRYKIVPCVLGESVVLVGAALMAADLYGGEP